MVIFMTVKKYSERSGIPESEIRRMAKEGLIESVQRDKGTKIYIKADDNPPQDLTDIRQMLIALTKQFNTPL